MFPCCSKIQFLVNMETILQELDEIKNEIHLLQMDVRTGREAAMTFLVVPLGQAEPIRMESECSGSDSGPAQA